MKVQLLSFPGCPNAGAAREALRRALATTGMPPHFEECDVTAPGTPQQLRAWGSPTILVDGRDVAGADPSGPCCRLYGGGPPDARGVPPEGLIRAALNTKRQRRPPWLRALAVIPGAALALLPVATCPACLGAYFAVLSAVGLGFLASERVIAPLIGISLALGLGTVAWSTKSHRHPGPLIITITGSVAVVFGRIVWDVPAVLYGAVALLIGAALWNLWLQRPRREPLVQLRHRNQNEQQP